MQQEYAQFGAVRASSPVEIRHDAEALDEPGFWVVVMTFEGELTACRMADVDRDSGREHAAHTPGAVDATGAWSSSLDQQGYVDAVRDVRERIARGEVYQVNVCRVLSRPVPADYDLDVLYAALLAGNPAPYACRIRVPSAGLDVASASPELYLARDGDRLTSGPIKGTAPSAELMLEKDRTENVMITDLVRNDLQSVCAPGTVAVDGLCVAEEHPGLTHLVSRVVGRLRPDVGWPRILDATFPPGSVSGAPKSTALKAIAELETSPRGPYCGAIGWVDNETQRSELAVGIRTFWTSTAGTDRRLHFGTGAGITWGSDPEGEWNETLLKAARLTGLAQRTMEETA